MKVFYNTDYHLAEYPFDTTRKSKWIRESFIDRPIPDVEWASPQPVSEELLCEVHDSGYVAAVRTGHPRSLALSQNFEKWDSGLWTTVLASNGGAVAAALAAREDGVAGSLSSGLHHASRDAGAGYCTFNGLALAARAAQAAGVKDLVIIDLDAHCGGGTASLLGDDPGIWLMDVSVNSFDYYTLRSDRSTLDMVSSADEYLPTVQERLAGLDQAGPEFDLCLYNAGMDPHGDCGTGGMSGISSEILRERDRLVFKWCERNDIPVAFVLAGGYKGGDLTKDQLVELHRLTISAAAESWKRRSQQ